MEGIAELRQAAATLKRPPVRLVKFAERDAEGRVVRLVERNELAVDLQAITDTGIELVRALNAKAAEMSREDKLAWYGAFLDFAATLGKAGATGNAPELAQTWTDEAERVATELTDAGYEVKGWSDGR